ncbi:unnamed protein product [Phytophthora fragariaefolia]|uniref:Unnamed protein product n=1 Tax=Phytophthora fragariaefolia TaxID=1490495 RepID=A0A9W6YER0_9STRA|nr:unnamed protein product [Phytophthora fragariaefolia]
MELCARWTALGSFHPFSRNHNNLDSPAQETYVWPKVVSVGQKFIGMRHRLLPYIYTLGYHAHSEGLPIARSLLMEFPTDTVTHNIDHQFMLGDALLVTPVVNKGATTVTGYFPRGTWYNIFYYDQILTSGVYLTFDVTIFDMPVHIRGGTIVAMHQPALTTTFARLTPFDVLIALPVNGIAAGDLYLDDGETVRNPNATIVKFTAVEGTFTSIVLQNDYADACMTLVNKVVILGVKLSPSRVSIALFLSTTLARSDWRLVLQMLTRQLPRTSRSFGISFVGWQYIIWRSTYKIIPVKWLEEAHACAQSLECLDAEFWSSNSELQRGLQVDQSPESTNSSNKYDIIQQSISTLTRIT